MTRPYMKKYPSKKYATGRYGLTSDEFFCQSCGKPTKGKGKEVKEDGNTIKVCRKCWKK